MLENNNREIAHDFNNLLTAIAGAADAILERSNVDPATRADVANIRDGVMRGITVIARLHSRARDSEIVNKPIYINEAVRASSFLLAHRLGTAMTLTLTLGEPDREVRIDPSQLDRVLLNLIVNASHAMPDGGLVTLKTRHRAFKFAVQRVPDEVPSGNYIEISVADTGGGIPPELLSRIFEPGISGWRNGDGSGLGLSSVRTIVHQAAGFIAADTVEGYGTLFEVYLPCEDAKPSRSPATDHRSDGGGIMILLVDDDPLVRQFTERMLCGAGWLVLTADSAMEAIEVLRENSCDLIISDVAMPGMDGLALTRLALAFRPELPIVISSGYENISAGHEFDAANVTFIQKPYRQAELRAAVERAIGQRVS
jgi:two-component system cell cycle sensor histidine kinase/response regulator CckA